MIVLTGAAGFIGSVILGYLNQQGRDDIIIVDNVDSVEKQKNLGNKKYFKHLAREDDFTALPKLEAIIHFGANSNTLETDRQNINRYNIHSTSEWHEIAKQNDAKFIFASSAAVYGNGAGPLNYYADSKLASEQGLYDACILRLFNVYGPNEYHKGRMASTFYHWYNQSKDTGKIKLFKNSENYLRDFIYVEDVAKVVDFFINNYKTGVFDTGTGITKSFAYAANMFKTTINCEIELIEIPEDLKKQYQAYSCANLSKLIDAGYKLTSINTVEQGLAKYLKYLQKTHYY
jgi:ADP-L-glycero-D-manno-heptose 6-epimerase